MVWSAASLASWTLIWTLHSCCRLLYSCPAILCRHMSSTNCSMACSVYRLSTGLGRIFAWPQSHCAEACLSGDPTWIVIHAVRCSPCTAPQSCRTPVSWHGSHSLLPSAWPTLLPQSLRVAEDVLQVTFKSFNERSGIASSRMLIVRSLNIIFRLSAQPVSEPCPSDPAYSRRQSCKPDSLFSGLMTSFFWGAVVPLTPGRTIFDELFISGSHIHC